jgi:Na+-transporting NADH:ubiquinone oxidoreductase subunit NqrE
MLTFIKMVVRLDEPAELFGEDFLAVAIFSAIGLLLTLVAVSCGMQGVWL